MGAWTISGLTERLLELHGEGRHNISEMTRTLADEFRTKLTKNAVIGKLHRMHLQTPRMATTTKRRKKKPAAAVSPRVVKMRGTTPSPRKQNEATVEFVYYPPVPPVPQAGRNLTIYELTSNTCRFPTSGSGEDCRFCGLKNLSGLPYCRYHTSVAQAPPMPAKRRAR